MTGLRLDGILERNATDPGLRDKVALIHGEVTLTFAQLDEQ